MDRLLLVHLVSTAFLCGLIWVIQLVHYPLFDRADRTTFPAFEAAHSSRITWIVAPMMLLEAATAIGLVLSAARGQGTLGMLPAAINLALVVLVWASTAFLQVPAHQRLAHGFDVDAHAWLVQTNWIRTALWTLRTLGLAAWLAR